LVQDSDEVKQILEEIKPQLPEVLQIKLWPTGHLPFFQAKVEMARHRIEARRSQAPLRADIAERCHLLNEKKAALNAKANTSAHSRGLRLLEKELEDLKAKVQATEQRIQDEKDLIARSAQEAENLTTQLKTELIELSVLSQQIVSGEDKDDEAVIAEPDRVRLEAIAAIDEFLQ
jgi:chromosome segregation ATPase